jgi:asparagine synthase (glutamine-hydrolysing)
MLVHDIPRNIDIDTLNSFISLRYSGGSDTIIKDVQRLLPGHYFTINLTTNKLIIKKFWDLSYKIEKKGEKFFVKKFKEELSDAVERRLISDVPLGAYLSGGIDSSSIIAMMSKFVDTIKTYSISFGYGGGIDENKFAEMVSEKYSTNHKNFVIESDIMKKLPEIIWHGDEPNADTAIIPFYLLAEKAKQDVTVIISGEGADEIFGGYEQNKFLLAGYKFRYLPKPLRYVGSQTVKVIPKKVLEYYFPFITNVGEEAKNRFCNYATNVSDKARSYFEILGIFNDEERKRVFSKQTLAKIKVFDHTQRLNQKYFSDRNEYLNQILRLDTKEPLPENLLMKTDRSSLAWAVEVRIPFLDYNLIELAGKMPIKFKLKDWNNEKYIIRKAMKGYVPDAILKRRKHRFYVPIDFWLGKDSAMSMVDSLLDHNTVHRQGFFNSREIDKIKHKFDSSRLFISRQLWTLLNFQLWYKIFIEEDAPNNKGRLPKMM